MKWPKISVGLNLYICSVENSTIPCRQLLSLYISIFLSFYQPTNLPICTCSTIYLSTYHLSIHPSIYLPIYLFKGKLSYSHFFNPLRAILWWRLEVETLQFCPRLLFGIDYLFGYFYGFKVSKTVLVNRGD